MPQATAHITWERAGSVFTDQRYSRGHEWNFDGGISVPASASPQVVRLPLSVAEAVDPEEALAAAAASCHMLWFLALAAQRGVVVDRYEDHPVADMGRNAQGRDAITRIELRPRIEFGGEAPTADTVTALHHEAHVRCMIANSLACPVEVQQVSR